jgi:ABC-type dipeptide/oligopeptide/nickel transport system ATPase subunit
MTSPSEGGVAAPGGIAELGAEAQRARTSYGEGALVVCDQVVRIYTGEGIEVQALQGLDLLIDQGELVAMVGASGSGKSTLMNILAGLDTPAAGRVRVAGLDVGLLTAKERLIYRRQQVGFVWQQTSRNLLHYLPAKQNVMTPMRFNGYRFEAGALEGMGELGVRRHQLTQAAGYFEQALNVYRHIDHPNGMAGALRNLGDVCLRRGQYQQAIGYLRDALAWYRHIGNQYTEILTLRVLAQSLRGTGQPGDARSALTTALRLAPRQVINTRKRALIMNSPTTISRRRR